MQTVRLTMSVKEMAAQMGISMPKAYELVQSPGFPVIRIGRKWLIPADSFKRWVDQQTAKEA